MASAAPKVAFLGLGAMGFAMSTHLVRRGFDITGFDVWKPTLDRFVSACERIPQARYSTTSSAADAVKGAQVIVLMVATHQHVDSALFESKAVTSMSENATIIVMATVPPLYTRHVRGRLDHDFDRPDLNLIDAPVSGGTVRSADGTLTIMAATETPDRWTDPMIAHVLGSLSTNGETLYKIPGGLGAGSSAKALNQVQCGIHIVASSEIMALAALNGLNTQTFYADMKGSTDDGLRRKYGYSWMFENRGPRMLDTSIAISSAVSIINKDVGIIVDETLRLKISLPLVKCTHDLLKQVMQAGMDQADDAHINQFILDPTLQTERRNLTRSRTKSSTLCASDHKAKTELLLLGHAIINFQSAYETCQFAEALDLMGLTQRKMWFAIIAGAAGGSRVFSEVVPVAFAAMDQGRSWTDGFTQYANSVWRGRFGNLLPAVWELVADAKANGVQPALLEQALSFLAGLQI